MPDQAVACEDCGRVMVRGEDGWIEIARSELYCSNCYEPVGGTTGDDRVAPGRVDGDPMYASPQFWESAPVGNPDRVYFTAESDGRVIAGSSGRGATLTNDQVESLTRWLIRVGALRAVERDIIDAHHQGAWDRR